SEGFREETPGQGIALRIDGWVSDSVELWDPQMGLIYHPTTSYNYQRDGKTVFRHEWHLGMPAKDASLLGSDPYNGIPQVYGLYPEKATALTAADLEPWRGIHLVEQ